MQPGRTAADVYRVFEERKVFFRQCLYEMAVSDEGALTW